LTEENKENNLSISNTYYDLGGNPCTKENVINGFKMKNKVQLQTLSYQQNLEKNSKPENIFVSFLSNKSISKLTNLEVFKNMKHLYLSNNKIQSMSGLETLVNLNILELNNNFIRKIEGIENLVNLQTLNLEQNMISRLENISNNINMMTLNISQQTLPKNTTFVIDESSLPFDGMIQNLNMENVQISDIRSLKVLRTIKILKLKHNKIEELNYVLEALKEMQSLENLNLLNNPLKEPMKNCRDIVIIYSQNLKELNDKTVTNNERSFLNSFYSRKSNMKPTKTKIKKDNMTLNIIKVDANSKNESFPTIKNHQYYNFK